MLVQLAHQADEVAYEHILIQISVQPDRVAPINPTGSAAKGRRRTPLQKWHLKRVSDHVDGRLSRRITLADMAAAAGLTRMHFAVRFRAATGMRPHDFLLQRRINRAQELMCDPKMALVDVALSVGFQTQAHFTTVFKRFAGETPNRWRRLALEIHAPQQVVFRQSAMPLEVAMDQSDW